MRGRISPCGISTGRGSIGVFDPRTIAVVGDKASSGYGWLHRFKAFDGTLYSVHTNPNSATDIEKMGIANFSRVRRRAPPARLRSRQHTAQDCFGHIRAVRRSRRWRRGVLHVRLRRDRRRRPGDPGRPGADVTRVGGRAARPELYGGLQPGARDPVVGRDAVRRDRSDRHAGPERHPLRLFRPSTPRVARLA